MPAGPRGPGRRTTAAAAAAARPGGMALADRMPRLAAPGWATPACSAVLLLGFVAASVYSEDGLARAHGAVLHADFDDGYPEAAYAAAEAMPMMEGRAMPRGGPRAHKSMARGGGPRSGGGGGNMGAQVMAAGSAGDASLPEEAMVAQTVTMDALAANVTALHDWVLGEVERLGGRVSDSSVNRAREPRPTRPGKRGRRPGDRHHALVHGKVPAGRLEEFLEAAAAEAGHVQSLSRRSEDVTAQYVDAQIRHKNDQAAIARLTALLERANTVREVLDVQRELQRQTSSLEAQAGQMKWLADRAAMADVRVQIRPEPVEGEEHPQPPPPPSRLARAAVRALNRLQDTLVFALLYVAPLGLLLLGVALPLRRFFLSLKK